jgi:hypothetical protein
MDRFSEQQDPPIKMNYAAAHEHVPRAERNNRVIQERVRSAYHRFPYTHLPRILVKYLVMESTKKLNFFPNKNGVSKYFSPRIIMHHETLDYKRHCKYQIGEYVQAHEEPQHTNTNASRSLDCIYLRPMDNAQGGHGLLHLQTNKVVKRRKLTKIPITSSIIKQVHAFAVLEEMPEGLKIKNRANNIIFDSAWIAGVDSDEEEFDDKEYTEEEDDIEEEDDNYDEMDANELADILQEPNGFQIPHEPGAQANVPEDDQEDEQEIIFEEANNTAEAIQEEEIFEDYNDEEYEPDNEEDILLEADDKDGKNEDDNGSRRTGRVRVPPQSWQHLHARKEQTEEYSSETAQIIAMTMLHCNTALAGMNHLRACNFLQTYSLKQGIKKFRKRGVAAANKEMKQLHDCVVF